MANRPELQNKGKGRFRSERGASIGTGVSHKGISQEIKNNKRAEAVERNHKTPHSRTRQHRRRCTSFGKTACSAA